MKSFTLHNLDPVLAEALERRARREGRSLNRTSQDLLRAALGIESARSLDHTDSFRDLCGTWDESQLQEFNQAVATLEQVDPADWKK